MKKTYGIELEMAIYYKNEDRYNDLCVSFEDAGFEIDDDGSLYTEDIPEYSNHTTAEIKSDTFSDVNQFLLTLKSILFNKSNPYTITINESGGDIRIDFNKSTGTHIHFSSEFVHGVRVYDEDGDYDSSEKEDGDFYITDGTRELKIFDENICEDLTTYIYERTTKYPSIQSHYFREYAKKRCSKYDRYTAINIANSKGHGTLEFRMCNLMGVKTKEMIPALRLQFNLVTKAIKRGYRTYLKSEKIMKKRLMQEHKTKLSNLTKDLNDIKKLLKEDKNENKVSRKQKSKRNYSSA